MLIFSDAEKFVRVLRVNGERRARVGVIMKNTFELKADENAALSEAESSEIQGVIASYQQVEQAQRRLDILRFPQIMRLVTEHYQVGADELEKRLIASTLVEAQRLIRRADRENAPPAERDNPQLDLGAGAETVAQAATSRKSRGRR